VNRFYWTQILLAVALISCEEPKQLTWKKYIAWLQDHPEIVSKTKEVNDIKISLDYIPADVSAYREFAVLEGVPGERQFDSLRQFYKCGFHFQLRLEADPVKKNLLFYNTHDETDYKQRIETLSFFSQEFVSLESNGKEDFPVLSQYEGYNELSNKIVIHLVFNPSWFTCDAPIAGDQKMAIVFKDPYWETGINRFAFDTQQLKSIPTLKL